MKSFCASLLISLFLVGCTPQAESNSPTESEKMMLQCKDNLRGISFAGLENPMQGPATCPAAGKDTYSEHYDDKTRLTYCAGHHHQKAGLEPDYPRIVEMELENKTPDRNHALQVKETADGVTPLPKGFPLPLDAPAEVLSTVVGRRDGTWKVYLKYEGDYKILEEKWRKSLNDLVYNPHASSTAYIRGKTMLANQISATLNSKDQRIEVRYEPAFLINDL